MTTPRLPEAATGPAPFASCAEALTVMPMTPSQFGKYIVDEIAHWTAVAHDSNIEGE